jgi:hypothetical protein
LRAHEGASGPAESHVVVRQYADAGEPTSAHANASAQEISA